jgi:hypothetical protein
LSEFWQNSQYLVEHNGIYFAGENSWACGRRAFVRKCKQLAVDNRFLFEWGSVHIGRIASLSFRERPHLSRMESNGGSFGYVQIQERDCSCVSLLWWFGCWPRYKYYRVSTVQLRQQIWKVSCF